MPDDLIQNRIQDLNPFYRSFVESDFSEEAAKSFAQTHTFNERQTEILENAVLLYLLFFANQKETVEFISTNCGLTLNEAETLFYGLLTTLPPDISSVIPSSYLIFNPPAATAVLASELAATEREFAAVTTNHEVSGMGIRTMADDMRTAQSTAPTISPTPSTPPAPMYKPIYPAAPETIYTSNQADIFPTPQPAQNQDQKLPPRWDSERQ